MLRACVFTLVLSVFSIVAYAQKDLPNPPSDFQIIPAGSYVVAMDTAHQKWPAVGQTIFNLKAYGLINQFLQKQFPVKWAIKAGKSLNGIDFTASSMRQYPTATTPSIIDFRGGPFIVPDTTICGVSTQSIIQSFGNNVCVYKLVNTELIDIRYTITNAPKIAIFTNGGNQAIHAKILTAAGISNFDYMDATNIASLSNCYTLVSEPHWDFNDADSVVVNKVKNFVINGGNFFAQCQALETYENYGFFATTSGINILNSNVVHTYHNADLPILQINGLVIENQGGSVRNWAPKTGSSWRNTTYKVLSKNGGDTVVSIGMHLATPSTIGGNAFFLGSHDYYSLTNLKSINALRMYLNAAIMPSVNNTLWARAGIDQTMTCSGAANLGCPPTGPPGATYLWTPSAGLNCTNCPNPSSIPSTTTNYTVTVTNTRGCTATDNVLITTNLVYPVANFSTSAGAGNNACVNMTINFTDHSTNGAVSWQWDFGDSTTSNLQHPTHTYASAGSYTVTCTASNSLNCTNSVQQIITINPNPVVSFSFNPACINHTTCFTNSSSINSGSITNWSWNFGDTASASNTSSQQSPCHSYIATNSNITLTATSNAGCISVLTQPISFTPDPVASFNSTLSCETRSTCFTDLSTVSSGSIVTWEWNFIDPSANDSATSQNPCYVYSSNSGIFAQLTVTTDNGCQDTITLPVSLKANPQPDFNVNIPCMGGVSCFNDLSSISSGVIVSNHWNFDEASSGTNNISSLQNPCHTYTNSGIYNVELITVSDLGCEDTTTITVEVAPIPVADFSPSWACFGTQNCFTNLSSIASGSITNYSWIFADSISGASDTSTMQSPCYLFSTYNQHTVTLILLSDKGCADTLIKAYSVSSNPQAAFTSTTVCPGIATCFSDASTISSGTIVDWQWNFSDTLSGLLDSTSVQNPCHIFFNNSSPQISLTVTSDIGCHNTITHPVDFNAVPETDFNWTPTCFGSQTLFNDLSGISSGSILSHTWNFDEPVSGLSNISILQNPSHTYSSANNFDVTLTTISNLGCQSNVTYTIPVSPIPVANFSTSPVCLGGQSCFTNSSTIASGTIASQNWNFGDASSGSGNTSSIQDPCHIYNTLNSYNVTLIEFSDQGCSDTITSAVNVNPVPVANFSSTIVCRGSSTCFTDQSSISSGSISGWQWNFSDPGSGLNDTSVLVNPCHTFLNTSSPAVSLTVNSNMGCQNTIATPVSFNVDPVPDFSAPTSCMGTATCFADLSTLSAGSIVNHQWTFGELNSGSNNSGATNPCHTYGTANSFDVILSVTTDKGCEKNITKPVSVTPVPDANFSAGRTCEGNQTCFNDLSTVSAGSIVSYNWDFGDPGVNNNSSAPHPCHLFTTLNTYAIKLIVTSDNGCKDSTTAAFAMSPLPVTNFNSTIVCPGNATCFSDASTIPSGSIVNYNWNFSDAAAGSADSSGAQNPCHTFINLASPNVMLTVTSDSGCSQTYSAPVIFNEVPVPLFTVPATCFGNQSCFTNLSTISTGNIIGNVWNFGDINSSFSDSSSIQNACHNFSADGTYNVMLTVISNNGCQNNITIPTIISPVPLANFSFANACIGDQTCFSNLSSVSNGNIISYDWGFGDVSSGMNNNSTLVNPCHSFNTLNPYNITLIVTSDNGCTDTLNSMLTISPVPVANFSSSQVCPGDLTLFHDQSSISSGSVTNWKWNFQGSMQSDSSTLQNPTYSFADSMANATLIITSDNGCQDTITQAVSFNPVPVANFTTSLLCFGTQTCFTDLSAIWQGTISNYSWNFGDVNSGTNNSASVNTPCHNFSTVNSFNVSLVVTSDFGCKDSITNTLKIISPPNAGFTAYPVCMNSLTDFINTSTTVDNDNIGEWEWNFGDGDSSPLQSPSHQFDSVKTFNVSLIITTATGCKDTINNPVTVHAQPIAAISSPKSGCAPVCVNFSEFAQPVEGTITNRYWNFPGGVPSSSTLSNPVVCYSGKGYYPVTYIVTNSFGCSDTVYSRQQTKIFPNPDADFSVIKEPDNSLSPEIELGHLWSNDVINWYWNFGDNTPVDSVNMDPSHTYKQPFMNNNLYKFNVSLNVKNQFGCVARINREINVKPSFSFFIPNTFTPNGDYPNDQFFAKGWGIIKYKISIFDRWGLLLWQCDEEGDYREWDKDNGDGMPSACKWDGIYHGSPVQQDTYIWKVEYRNVFGEDFKDLGHVNVIK